VSNRLISLDQSVIVALDALSVKANHDVVCALENVPRIGGFKVGFGLGLLGLQRMNGLIRDAHGTQTTIIYDQQKAGTDIPETGILFAKTVKQAGCDAAILFPQAGPATQRAWTKACFDENLRPIIGLAMTHAEYFVSEGGYIADDAPERAFRIACSQGVRDFVVPGTKIAWVKKLRAVLVEELGEGNFDLYAPGFISQGGDITECGKAAGARFHAIVGSAIYSKTSRQEMRTAAEQATLKLAA
jgi:orotidine-5'-phosphate decarboxylase